MPRTRENIIGKQFGKLMVVELDDTYKPNSNLTYCKCKCECGNYKTVTSSDLKRGHTKSCGCNRLAENIVGNRYGKLQVIKRSGSDLSRQSTWECLCDCGKIKIVSANALKFGYVKSCGCLNEYDLIGNTYGRLTVIEKDILNPKTGSYWICKCDCGKIKSIKGYNLVHNIVQSCGCINREISTTHGKSGTRLYRIYIDMKRRCYLPANKNFKYYGERGIKICDSWLGN